MHKWCENRGQLWLEAEGEGKIDGGTKKDEIQNGLIRHINWVID